MSALSDVLRSRILVLLEGQELTVTELCEVLQLPQSTVSRHLKTLVDGGWAESRPDGTRRLYQMPLERLDSGTRRLWLLAREQVGATGASEQDRRRLVSVLAERRRRSREFFDTGAASWDSLREDLFGPRFFLLGLLGLIPEDSTVADLGCGTGPVAEALAPFVERLIAIDGSDAMLDAARSRLARFDNVSIQRGDLEALPVADGEVDAATLILVLHHLPDPGKVVAEVSRILRPGGRLLILDMLPHDRQDYTREMGHVWMGFSPEKIDQHLAGAGLERTRFATLPDEPKARGPSLFAATAVRR
jgi:ArsR family transcriptional regulator